VCLWGKLVLTASEAVCHCGADHTALVREERASEGGTHSWDEEHRESRKEWDEYFRTEYLTTG
jgi:hypothetical protein